MSDFSSAYISREDYAYLAIELFYREQRVCQVLRRDDEGIEVEIIYELYELPSPVQMRFPLEDFLAELEIAKRELLALKLR